MSLAAACGWTLLRSLFVALLTVPLGWHLHSELTRLSHARRRLFWTLLLVPFLTPALLTGYAYSNFSVSLIRYPKWNESLYMLLMAARLLPIGVLIMHFAPPPPMSREAVYSARLAISPSQSFWRRTVAMLPFVLRGPLRVVLPAFAVLFLLVFQEFELASLMGTVSWTVWLFDAQAGGLFLRESLRLAIFPLLVELAVLAPLIMFVLRARTSSPATSAGPKVANSSRRILPWLVAGLGSVAVLLIPFVLIGSDTLQGLGAVLRSPSMLSEIGVAAGFGIASGLCALLGAVGLLKFVASRSPATATGTVLLFSLPGLTGSLIVSLVMLATFQLPIVHSLYGTPLPALLALVLFLLPRAVLIQLLLQAARPQEGLWLAQLLSRAPDGRQRHSSRSLVWQLSMRGQLLAACVICLWGYLELTPVSILAPPGLTSAPVRLYNLMHYGRSHVLSSLTLVSMTAPVILALVGVAVARLVNEVYWKLRESSS